MQVSEMRSSTKQQVREIPFPSVPVTGRGCPTIPYVLRIRARIFGIAELDHFPDLIAKGSGVRAFPRLALISQRICGVWGLAYGGLGLILFAFGDWT